MFILQLIPDIHGRFEMPVFQQCCSVCLMSRLEQETPSRFTDGLSTAKLELVLITVANSFCQRVWPYLNFKLTWLWQQQSYNMVNTRATFFLNKIKPNPRFICKREEKHRDSLLPFIFHFVFSLYVHSLCLCVGEVNPLAAIC